MRRIALVLLVLFTSLFFASPTFARRNRHRRLPTAMADRSAANAPATIAAAAPEVGPDFPAPPGEDIGEDAASTIREVRARRGSVLEGTLLADEQFTRPSDQDDFQDALLAAATSREATPSPSRRLPGSEVESPGASQPLLAPPPTWVQVARREARRLDATASELEDAGLYADADQLRELAGVLRQRARQGGAVDSR